MSAKERDRLKVLHEVKKRHITQKQAAAELGLSVRWVRKLLLRLRAGGDAGLRHGLRSQKLSYGQPAPGTINLPPAIRTYLHSFGADDPLRKLTPTAFPQCKDM